jgi:hypothetical protein
MAMMMRRNVLIAPTCELGQENIAKSERSEVSLSGLL